MKYTIGILILLLFSCDLKENKPPASPQSSTTADSLPQHTTPPPLKLSIDTLKAQGAKWVDISLVAPDIHLDIRYATTNNFTKQQIYDCPKCLLRLEVAEALLGLKAEFLDAGYGLLLFDCFRPLAAQESLWAIKPDKRYVTPPSKGSMHNRGAAVDITLTDLDGKELDMGTDYDVFSKVAWHRYRDLSEEVLARRVLLKETMERHGFKSITTEWWHYSYVGKKGYGIRQEYWECE